MTRATSFAAANGAGPRRHSATRGSGGNRPRSGSRAGHLSRERESVVAGSVAAASGRPALMRSPFLDPRPTSYRLLVDPPKKSAAWLSMNCPPTFVHLSISACSARAVKEHPEARAVPWGTARVVGPEGDEAVLHVYAVTGAEPIRRRPREGQPGSRESGTHGRSRTESHRIRKSVTPLCGRRGAQAGRPSDLLESPVEPPSRRSVGRRTSGCGRRPPSCLGPRGQR